MKILCVEDDKFLAKQLQITLIQQNYQVDVAADGQIGWNFVETSTYDLILLDLILPKLDGISFCKQLRTDSSSPVNPNRNTPVLLMTAVDTVTNKVMGLDAGADDYVVKPFNLEELLARIRALIRRTQQIRTPLLTWGELCLNPNNCQVTYQNQPIVLASKEYAILELFLRHPDQIFSPSRLLDRLWTFDHIPSEGAVRAQIKSLRQKFRQAGADDIFETIYKLGYRLKQQKVSETLIVHSPPSITLRIAPELQETWLECRQSYCDRISVIQQAVITLKTGKLTQEQQHQAEREAHTLVGSLGCFGLDEASRLSRCIQQILKREKALGQIEAEQLEQLLTALQHYIDDDAESINPYQTSLTSSLSFLPSSSALLLIIDDDLPLAKQIAIEAIIWGLQAEIAIDFKQAEEFLSNHHFDVIILDLNFPTLAESGLDFLAIIRKQYPQIPVIVFTVDESLRKRVEVARLGSQYFLQKPITPHQLLEVVTQVLQQINQSPARLLVVDDDPDVFHLLHSLLEPLNYQLTLVEQPQQFWQILERTVPDLLILDVELWVEPSSCDKIEENPIPSLNGFDLCQVVRRDPYWNRLPILFLSAHTDIETIQRCFEVGADDFLSKPIVPEELLIRVQSRLEQRKRWNIRS